MQSHNGDIELNVTLNTKGVESDAKKIKKEIENATKDKVGMYVADDREQIKKEVQAMVDNVNKSLEDNEIDITPKVDKEEALKRFADTVKEFQEYNKQLAEQQNAKIFKGGREEWEEYKALHKTSEAVDAVKESVNELNTAVDETFSDASTDEYIASLDEIKNRVTALYENYDKGSAASYIVNDQIRYIQEEVGQLSEEEQDAFDQWFDDLQRTRRAAEELKKAQEQVAESSESSTSKANTEKYVSAIKDAQAQLKSLANDYLIMKEGFHYSEDFVRLKKDAESLTKELNNVNEKLHKMELEGTENTDKYAKMAEKANNLSMVLRNILIDMNTMRDDGSAFEEGIDPEQLQQVEKLYDTLATKTALMCKEKSDGECPPEKMKQLRDNALKAIPAIQKVTASILKMAGGNIKRSFSSIATFLKRMTSQAGRFAKQSTKMFRLRDILGYAIGIRSLFSLFTKLRGYITEGTNNLVRWRDGNNRANESLSTLTSTLQWMKNAWGAAFEPILTYVTPILDMLISKIAEVANAISYLMAKLTGQSTWMKAIRVQKDYAKSLSGTGSAAKEAEEGLAQYDKLVMVNKQNAGGGASANADIDDMFEEMSIDDAVDWVDDFLAKLKEAWDKADFTDIGNIIGLRLKDLLDSISWDVIKNFVEKSAKSLATLFNGFFETAGLAESIGKTIAETYNTIFDFVDKFVHTLHWDSIGKFIGEGLFSFIDTFDAKLAGSAIGGTIRGFIDMIYSALTTFSEGNGDIGGFELLGQKIADFVNTFVEEMSRLDEAGKSGWDKLGESLHDAVSGIFTALQTAIEGIDDENGWKKIGHGIGEVIKKIDFLQLGIELVDVANSLVEALAKAIVEFAVTAPLETAIASIIGLAVVAAVAGGVEVSAITIFIAAASVVLGFNLGELIGKALFPDDAMWYEEFNWTEFFNENELQDVLDGIDLMLLTFSDNVVSILTMLSDDAVFWWIEGTKADFADFVFWWSDIWDTMKEIVAKSFRFFVYLLTINISFALSSIDNFFKSVSEFLPPLLDDLAFWWSDILNMLSVWLEDIGFWWNDILEGAKALFDDCLFWIDDFFNNTLEYAENFGGDLELVLNNIIGFIEQVINSAIDGINALLSSIGSIDLDFSGLPSAIQDKIGTGISFDLPTFSHVSIPRLAQGAVIPPNKEFLAMLGDQKQGTNIETPLETMMEAFRAVLAENGSTNNEPIVLQLNGKVIAQAVWDEERKKYKQTGSYAY